MKKLSNFQITLLVVFGSLFVAGVLIFALATATTNKSSIAPVTVWGTFDGTLMTSLLQEAAAANKQLEQVTYEQKDPTTYDRDLTEALASGKGPDLFLLPGDYAAHDAGKIAHIVYASFSEAQFKNAFLDVANPYLVDDGILAIPFLVDPLVLFWNRDMLATAGYAVPPQYWDQAPAMVQKMTQKDDSGTLTKSGIAFGEYQNVMDAKDILSALIMQAGGTITSFDTKGNLISAVAPQGSTLASATTDAVGFYTEFADPSNDNYSWSRALPESQTAFATGDVGLYVGHASERALIARANPNLNFAVAPMPQIRAMNRSIDSARVYGLAVARTSKHVADATTVAYLLGSASIAKIFSTTLGMASALRSGVSAPAVGDADTINKQAIISRSWIDPDPVQTAGIFRGMIEGTVSGSSKLNDAVSLADKQMQQVIGGVQ